MASLQVQVEAVRNAVASAATCTPATVVSLKSLLLPPEADSPSHTSTSTSTSRTTSRAAPSRPHTALGTTRPGTAASKRRPADQLLSPKEKAQLATHVVNATLKALAEAAKPRPAPTQAAKEPQTPACPATQQPDAAAGVDDVSKTTRRLRRSMSAPLTPMQPRPLNRVPTSPVKSAHTGAHATNSTHHAAYLATVECARVAFVALRSVQDAGHVALPELQLEAGMSSFVAKLLGLGMLDQACRELRVLKTRLQGATSARNTASKTTKTAKTAKTKAGPKETSAAAVEPATSPSDLLDFDVAGASTAVLRLIVASQIQALRVLVAVKKPASVDAALSFLRRGCKASPLQNLMRCLQSDAPAPAEQQKALRQVETLSQLLLALAPSIASKDDATALEPKLSVSPATALELQTLSLEVRLWHWKLSGLAKADADKEILQPFARCLSAYARRSRSSGRPSYSLCRQCFEHVQELMHAHKHATARSCRAPIASIYQTLTAVARETGRLDDAIHWANQLCSFVNVKEDSAARSCSYSAQLLALQLKSAELPVQDSHKLLGKVLEAIQGPLKGDTAELEELLTHVCQVRKAAMNVLILHARKREQPDDDDAPTRQVMEAFVYQCPRFCLRWLGKPPAAKSSTKDFLRYEQRRQLLSQSIRPTLDSAFVVTKTMIEENRMAWDQLDSVLGDALTVLEYLGDLKSASDAASSYYVKISHFYYLSYNALRRSKTSEMDALKSLRRAIDCVKHRSGPEKSKAQLIPKLERMADLCRSMGQIGEALGALQSIRTSLVDDGVLAQVATLLRTQPPGLAWTAGDPVEALERALTAIARLEQVPIDWTGGLEDEERAAVLEHQLHFVCLGKSSAKSAAAGPRLTLDHPCIEALLGVYGPARFPVRRLRTLLRLFAANLDVPEALAGIAPQVKAVLEHVDSEGLADDASLEGYLAHYRTLATSLAGFSEGYADVQGLEACLSTWKTLVEDRPTRAALEQAVDSIGEWQTHLQSVAEFMRAMGRDGLLTAVLELSSRLCSVLSESEPQEGGDASSHRVQLAHDILLASHYVRVGECLKAEEILGKVNGQLQEPATGELAETVASFHLSYAEYLIAVGRLDEAHDHLIEAKPSEALAKLDGTQRKILGARASVMQSIVALDKGDAHLALQSARGGVRMLFHDWSRLEKQMAAKEDDEQAAVALSDATVDLGATLRETAEADGALPDASSAVAKTAASPAFWTLFHPLFEAMQRLSTVYAHLGMFQETLYYAEQAQKLATATNGAWALAQAEAWLSTVWLRAAKPEKALGLAGTARARMAAMDATSRKATLACELGGLCRAMKDDEGEKEMLQLAESIIEGLSISPAEVEPVDTGRKTRAGRRPKAAATTTRRKAAAPPAKAVVTASPPAVENAIVTELRAAVLVNQVLSLVDNKDWTAALDLLRADGVVSKRRAEILVEQVALAACLLGHSTEQMAADAVFSVIQDSTLSFPAVSAPGRVSAAVEGPLTKGKAASKTGSGLAFVEGLLEAQNRLIEAQTMAAMSGDAGTLLRISRMLQSAVITLSATSWSLPRAMGPPAYATCSVELARNMTWRRERRALLVEKAWADSAVESVESAESAVDRRASLGLSASDISRFQRDYIDIIPADWSVVSLALTENDQDLCITKFQAGQSPFVIRLPLEREISRDADTEVFRFQQGRAELLAIIAATNASCHDARDMTVKGAKTAWWTERTALDARLRELLDNVEQIWLGGFRGIFSQHVRRAEPFARFEKAFQTMLDKHLPSRRTVRGRRGGRTAAASASNASNHRVSLDARTLDLFIGLGDATADGCDFDDVLNDLLYFVVDILQFHGERNAYDEIDFDAMVIETFDALYAYHASVQELASGSGADSDAAEHARHAHTILVLDKALHVFPWEAMPCLQGTAVSRVPSLACLRDLLGKNGKNKNDKAYPGHHASAAVGAYMLNPSGDLSSTETTFDGPLSASVRGAWTRIVSRAPTEDEFEAVLRDKDVLLYFGHGSGAQYIRGRTVRRLEQCRATALLMGCSSAGLDYNGDFELHGPVWNYMLAGCPAVVGTLWDVTDKDIDRFAGRTFEEWGLLPRGSFDKAGGRKRTDKSSGRRSLVEAVMRAREAPRFRYLTAAAVCVYGIPVYLE